MRFHWLRLVAVGMVLLGICRVAPALIMSGGREPVTDRNWPAGTLGVANLSTRIGWWEGPPFGGGQWQFMYRGDEAALQDAVDRFAKIKAPQLRLVIQEGPHENQFARDPQNPNDKHLDWTFTVWDPRSWHQLYGKPDSFIGAEEPNDRSGKPVEPPCLEVYVAAPNEKGIDWTQIKVPPGIAVEDERATCAGYAREDASVIRGEVYDMVSSKPVSEARLVLMQYDGKKYNSKAVAKSDVDGKIELKKVPAGSYQIQIEHAEFVGRVIDHVGVGGNTIRKYIAYLAPPAKVSGTVKDTSGKPVAGVELRAESTRGADGRGYVMPESPKTKTDAQGRFEFKDIPQGTFLIFGGDQSHHLEDIIKLRTAPSKEIELRVTGTGIVKGRLVNAQGQTLAKGDVHIDPVGERIGKWGGGMQIKPDGTFEFKGVPPGKYTVSGKPGLAIQGKDKDAKSIEVKEGDVVEVEVVGK